MKAVSLFAGVGGFDLALESNDIEVVASVEIDKHAQKILTKHFPNTKIYEDVCKVTGKDLYECGFDPNDGILVGGFPCQDLSVAGKRAGLAGDRSGLFWEIHRLLQETQTKYFILENVPGLLSSNGGRDFGIVIGSLAQLGYGVAWRILDAQYFGVPQRRRRIFIVGCLGDDGRTPAQILNIAEGRAGYLEASGKARKGTTSAPDGSPRTIGTLLARDSKGIDQISVEEKREGKPGGGKGPMLNDKRAFTIATSNDQVLFIIDSKRVGDVRVYEDNIMQTVIQRWGTGGGNVPQIAYSIREDAKANTFSATELKVSNAIQALQPSPQSHHAQTFITNENIKIRRLTPIECERLQGFPDNWTEGQSDSHRYKQMGNAVAVPVVKWIVRNLINGTSI